MTNQEGKHIIEPESLVQLFLRLDGFFALNHFIVHRAVKYPYKVGHNTTIVGIRFPHRREALTHLLSDNERFTHLELPLLLLGEMKTDLCEFNPNWLHPNSARLKRILVGTGLFPTDELEGVVMALRSKGWYKNRHCIVQSVCFGGAVNPDLNMPEVIQITWDDLLRFAFEFFQIYGKNKMNHAQWEHLGQMIWHVAMQTPIYKTFREQFVVEKWEKDSLQAERPAEWTSNEEPSKPEVVVVEHPESSVQEAKSKIQKRHSETQNPKSKAAVNPEPSVQGAKSKNRIPKSEIQNPQSIKLRPVPKPVQNLNKAENKNLKEDAINDFLYRLDTKFKAFRPKSVDSFLGAFKSQMKIELTQSDLLKYIHAKKEPLMEIITGDKMKYNF